MQTVTLIVFCATVLPLIFTPGPDIIYITTRGIAQGRQAALISTLGVCTGYVVHTLLAQVRQLIELNSVFTRKIFKSLHYKFGFEAKRAGGFSLSFWSSIAKSGSGVDTQRKRMSTPLRVGRTTSVSWSFLIS